MKIGIFDQYNSTNNTWEVIVKHNLQDKFIRYPYTLYDDIKIMYEELKDSLDGILFTGSVGYNYFLKHAGLVKLPIMFIENSFESHYLLLIDHLVNHSEIPLNEVYIDTFDDNRIISALRDIIPEKMRPYIPPLDLDCFLPDLHDRLYDYIWNLWKSNKIKIAYIGYSDVYNRLKAAGMECKCIVLKEEVILISVDNIIRQVELNNYANSNTVAVLIDYMYKDKNDLSIDEIEYRQITLHKILVDYKRKYACNTDINIVSNPTNFEISFNRKYLEEDKKLSYLLLEYVDKKYEYDFVMGVGIGNDIIECRNRGYRAINFAKDFGDRCAFIVENDGVSGPVNSESCLEFSLAQYDKNKDRAKQLDMSNLNYTRVIALLENLRKNITSEIVAKYLNITDRSANRIITKLIEYNIIRLQSESKQGKGRPMRYYELTESSYHGSNILN